MINLHESMGPGRDQTHAPGSAVRLASVARHLRNQCIGSSTAPLFDTDGIPERILKTLILKKKSTCAKKNHAKLPIAYSYHKKLCFVPPDLLCIYNMYCVYTTCIVYIQHALCLYNICCVYTTMTCIVSMQQID